MLKYSQTYINEYIINLSYKQVTLQFNIKIRFDPFYQGFLHISMYRSNRFNLI
jgi:hypothetical protein